MRWIPTGVAVAVAAALTACGGGGSDSAAAPESSAKTVDFTPYAGNWVVCNKTSEESSNRYQITISQTGANLFHYEWLDTNHPNADCSGPGTSNYVETGDATASGETVLVDGIEAQKISSRVTHDGRTGLEDQFIALTPQGLRLGDFEELGADGKPHFMSDPFTQGEKLAVPPAPPPPPVTTTPPPPPPVITTPSPAPEQDPPQEAPPVETVSN